eukprot:12173174-Karenia_brevis.AAC.2
MLQRRANGLQAPVAARLPRLRVVRIVMQSVTIAGGKALFLMTQKNAQASAPGASTIQLGGTPWP